MVFSDPRLPRNQAATQQAQPAQLFNQLLRANRELRETAERLGELFGLALRRAREALRPGQPDPGAVRRAHTHDVAGSNSA